MRNLFLQSYKASALLSLCFLFMTSAVWGQITSTATGGNWNATTTWVGGVVPTAGNNVIIATGATVTLNAASFCNDLTINNGGTLNLANQDITINGATLINNGGILRDAEDLGTAIFVGTLTNNGTFTFTGANNSFFEFRGNVINNGTFTFTGANTSFFEFRGNVINTGTFDLAGGGATSPQVRFGTGTASSIAITNNASTAMAFGFPNNGTCTIRANTTLTINSGGTGNVRLFGNEPSGGVIVEANATLVNNNTSGRLETGRLTGAGTLINNGFLSYLSTSAPSVTNFDVDALGNTFEYSAGGTSATRAGIYHHLVLASSVSTVFGGATTVNGNLTSSGIFNPDDFALEIKGNWTCNGNFSTGTSTVTFSGTAAQTFSSTGSITLNNLVINNTATNIADRRVVFPNNNVTVNTNLTLTSGRIVLTSPNIFTYQGTNLLTGSVGWIETPVTSVFRRTGTGANFFYPVGDANAQRGVRFAESISGGKSVRFTPTITPTVSGTNPAAGMWVIDAPTNVTLAFSNVGGTANATGSIQRIVLGSWVAQASNFVSPTYTSSAPLPSGTYTIFTSPTTYYSTGTGNWTANIWATSEAGPNCGCNPATVPNAQVFIRNGHSLTVANAADINTNNQITVRTGGTFVLSNGNSNAISNLQVESGATLTLNNGSSNVLASSATINGTYIHNRNGGTIPTATWGASSECRVTGITSAALPIGGLNGLAQSFGNFTWDCPGQTASQVMNVNMQTQGNLSILNTNMGSIVLSSLGVRTITVLGNFILNPSAGNTARFFLANSIQEGTLEIRGNFNGGITPSGTIVFGITGAGASGATAEIRFSGAGNQVFNPPAFSNGGQTSTRYRIDINKPSGIVTFFPDNYDFTNANNTIRIDNGTFSISKATAQNITVGAIEGTGTLQLQNAMHRLTIRGANSGFSGILNASTPPSVAYLVGNQNIFPIAYEDLEIASGTKTLLGNISILGDFTNNGATLAGNHTVTFNGTTAQSIEGGTNTTFFGLTINKISNVLNINRPTSVSNALALSSGRLVLGDNNLTYTGAEANLTRNATSWIQTNGTGAFVRGLGGSNFTFPIGTATQYQPVVLANATAGASVRFGVPTAPVPNSGVGSWFVSNGATSNITLLDPQGGSISPGQSRLAVRQAGTWELLGNPNYPAINQYQAVSVVFTGATREIALLTPSSQSINFNLSSLQALGSIPLSATASSGLPVSFSSSNPLVASVSGSTLTLNIEGTVSITASQAGGGIFAPAADVTRVIEVVAGTIPQNITFRTELLTRAVGDPPFRLEAVASPDMMRPVSFSSSNPEVATITEAEGAFFVNIIGAGRATITASQAGDAVYLPAEVSKNLLVIVSGNESAASLATQLYPNPASREVELVPALLYGAVQYRLQSAQGHTLWQERRGDALPFRFSVEALPKGIYFLHIQNAQESFVKKIIVQ